MQNCMSETVKMFYGCFCVFVSVFLFKCVTAEIKFCVISVLFHFYFICAGTIR